MLVGWKWGSRSGFQKYTYTVELLVYSSLSATVRRLTPSICCRIQFQCVLKINKGVILDLKQLFLLWKNVQVNIYIFNYSNAFVGITYTNVNNNNNKKYIILVPIVIFSNNNNKKNNNNNYYCFY